MIICFATNNKHKIKEVAAMLPPSFILKTLQEIGCEEDLPEEKDTLEGNSLQKADYVFSRFGIPCIADDTGLEVDALDGRPGVYSARYAGPECDSEDNIRKLLSELEGVDNTHAKFRTVITLLLSGEQPHQFEGVVEGDISRDRGGTEGFGYDPVFRPEGGERTFAQMTSDEKNAISHRGRAVRKLVEYLISREKDLISS